jgi:hypothetical protein
LKRRPRRLERKTYAEERDSEAEDISGSDSEDEWVYDGEYTDDNEDMEVKPVKKGKKVETWRMPVDDTDDEEEDTDEVRANRRNNKAEMRQLIMEKLVVAAPIDPRVWVPDEKDEVGFLLSSGLMT